MKKILALLLLGITASSYGVVNIIWGASAGFYFNADHSVGILGDGTGNSTRAQLMYSPDNVKDDINASGAGFDNDVILASVTITEDGVPGNQDDYASFAENYTGSFAAGYVYAVIFQDNVYGAGDWYYYTPMAALRDGGGFPQIIEMNADRVNGDAIDFGPNVCQNLAPALKELTVNGGTGSGYYSSGEQVEISANAPATGKAFSQWAGDTQYVDSVTSPDATVTMPAQDITLTAVYVDVYYTLTVNQGTGDGSYTNGQQVAIEASGVMQIMIWPPPLTKLTFSAWTGDIQCVASVTSASTAVTMPATNITVTATYMTVTNDLALWMAQHGLTNYSSDVDADPDGDGLTTWQEYIAGTDPTNAVSGFCVMEDPRNVLGWSAVSGRVYSVYWTTNLMSGFQCLESNIPWTQGSFTNETTIPYGYYKVGVRLEN